MYKERRRLKVFPIDDTDDDTAVAQQQEGGRDRCSSYTYRFTGVYQDLLHKNRLQLLEECRSAAREQQHQQQQHEPCRSLGAHDVYTSVRQQNPSHICTGIMCAWIKNAAAR